MKCYTSICTLYADMGVFWLFFLHSLRILPAFCIAVIAFLIWYPPVGA